MPPPGDKLHKRPNNNRRPTNRSSTPRSCPVQRERSTHRLGPNGGFGRSMTTTLRWRSPRRRHIKLLSNDSERVNVDKRSPRKNETSFEPTRHRPLAIGVPPAEGLLGQRPPLPRPPKRPRRRLLQTRHPSTPNYSTHFAVDGGFARRSWSARSWIDRRIAGNQHRSCCSGR